ncbi:hypothetical protein ACJX0J_033445, partial [Zea mays]
LLKLELRVLIMFLWLDAIEIERNGEKMIKGQPQQDNYNSIAQNNFCQLLDRINLVFHLGQRMHNAYIFGHNIYIIYLHFISAITSPMFYLEPLPCTQNFNGFRPKANQQEKIALQPDAQKGKRKRGWIEPVDLIDAAIIHKDVRFCVEYSVSRAIYTFNMTSVEEDGASKTFHLPLCQCYFVSNGSNWFTVKKILLLCEEAKVN